ncbi:GerMN domain-containing protein [Geomonas sp. Red32]|uniref:GerMN domain-containing protein n=1 Tax=Geomonas sp. Red32 TaxID=2912856 RepID=UPI00202D06B8|nr:GerMN domain-containing protein [Geomonas sp. Red32]MCM0080395.1 GerMN domain-containing protein [Geomonas sp. Red32]
MKKRTSKAKGILLISFLLFAVVIGGLLIRKYQTTTRTAAPAAAQEEPAGSVVVTLFFASPDGKSLVREGREIEIEEGVEDGIESVVDELISGPLGELSATLPSNVRIIGVKLNGPVAQIDFTGELKEYLTQPGQALPAIYSVVDSVTANFPQVKTVQILVDGAPLDGVAKLDLKGPLAPDYQKQF